MDAYRPRFETGESLVAPEFRDKLNEIADRAFRPVVGDDSLEVEDHPLVVRISATKRGVIAPRSEFWAEIVSVDGTITANRQWRYNFHEMRGPWTGSVTGGLSGTALNSIEANSASAQFHGNSIDVTGEFIASGDFAVKPVRGNPVLRMSFDNGLYGFQYVNAVDGACPATEEQQSAAAAAVGA